MWRALNPTPLRPPRTLSARAGGVSTSKGRLSSGGGGLSPRRTVKVQIQHADLKFRIKTGAGLHFMDENVERSCIYERNAVVFSLENKTASAANGPIEKKNAGNLSFASV